MTYKVEHLTAQRSDSSIQMPRKKKSKKESNEESSSHEKEKSNCETLHLNVTVCGDPQAIDLFTRKVGVCARKSVYCILAFLQNYDLNASVDKYQVSIYGEPGNDDSGKVVDRESDFFLCVYDICNPKSVDFLKNKVHFSGHRLTYRLLGDEGGEELEEAYGSCRIGTGV